MTDWNSYSIGAGFFGSGGGGLGQQIGQASGGNQYYSGSQYLQASSLSQQYAAYVSAMQARQTVAQPNDVPEPAGLRKKRRFMDELQAEMDRWLK